MNTLNWLLKPSKKTKAKEVERPIETPQLLGRIREERSRLATVEDQCHIQQVQIATQNGQLEKTSKELAHYKTQLAILQQKVTELSNHNLEVHRQFANFKNETKKNEKKARTKDATKDTTIAGLKNGLASAHTTLHKAFAEKEKLREDKQDLQFEIELLRCTQSRPDLKSLEIIPQPFVLVLVDGDAYAWSGSHRCQNRHPAGAHAAQAIKTQVQQYLLANKERIPLQSRIVTRVFKNLEEPLRRASKNTKAFDRTLDFAKSFTESMPLFDFFNAGDGKERVDEKIKETFHLFISNPHCSTVFLAAAKDNGFARLLEQYACIEAARAKVVLIHDGYIIHEICELGFPAVEWPSVFARSSMPVDAMKRRNKVLAHAQKARDRVAADVVRSMRGDMKPLRDLSCGPFGLLSKGFIVHGVVIGTQSAGLPEHRVEEADQESAEAAFMEDVD